jgi:hypothetical protein
MDKKGVITKILMAIGFVACGIGGAVTAGEIPENIEKAKKLLATSKEEETTPDKTEE